VGASDIPDYGHVCQGCRTILECHCARGRRADTIGREKGGQANEFAEETDQFGAIWVVNRRNDREGIGGAGTGLEACIAGERRGEAIGPPGSKEVINSAMPSLARASVARVVPPLLNVIVPVAAPFG